MASPGDSERHFGICLVRKGTGEILGGLMALFIEFTGVPKGSVWGR
jgi:hypothetical protein